MNIRSWMLMLTLLLMSTMPSAAENWLIATQNEVLNTSEVISIEAIKPASLAQWPEELTLTLSNRDHQEKVALTLVETAQASNTRRTYKGVSKTSFIGTVRAELSARPSNRLLMLATDRATENAISGAETIITSKGVDTDNTKKKPNAKAAHERVVVSSPEEDPTITANEPLYFLIGSNDERNFDARFQLSFKYRPFDPEARVATFIPYASNIYFAYTQTSIWDLGGDSSPFRDTSYRPSLYYNWSESGNGFNPNNWKFGVEHESNGRDGDESRSLNIAFVQPHWNIDFSGGKRFTFMPRLYSYIEKSDNRDMHYYRGYVDWLARYGREDAAILTGMYRQGTGGYAMGQLDLSYPISDKIFGRTGTFLHLQLLGGYGETLIDYNRRSDAQLRIGISLAR